MSDADAMQFDVLIVGGGPAGLSAAIRLKQLSPDISICLLEKGSEIGAHIISGCAFEPRALNELLPDWRLLGAPLTLPAHKDRFWLLNEKGKTRLPVPPTMKNEGNYLISLADLCRWLARQAEGLGVQIFPGFPAAGFIFENNRMAGVTTGEFGRGKNGQEKTGYQAGMPIRAKYTLLAEGCRGSLTKMLMSYFKLNENAQPQTYGLGVKEIWEVDPAKHRPGEVMHTVGWPLDIKTYGGSFIYHLDDNKVAAGLIVGLDYQNPTLDPFAEFQRFKTHPNIRPLFEGGRRIAYGARAISEGGLQSIPALSFPGGALVGDAAGFLNVAKIKGSHTAMKSGMLAAEAVFEALQAGEPEPSSYTQKFKESWLHQELKRVRNIRPGFRTGLLDGLMLAAIDTYVFRGHAPWTLKHRKPDSASLKPLDKVKPIEYPKPDGVITFDKLSSVYLSNTNHVEDQPCHLKLRDTEIPERINLPVYGGPEEHYCPANVYEYLGGKLHINAQNCVHCKTCDIKDPEQNIVWLTPEGGGGPNYGAM